MREVFPQFPDCDCQSRHDAGYEKGTSSEQAYIIFVQLRGGAIDRDHDATRHPSDLDRQLLREGEKKSTIQKRDFSHTERRR